MDAKTTAVIVNPAAGGGAVGKQWPDFESRIRTALGDVTFYRTTGLSDGIAKATQAVHEGASTVFSLGGDGTHGEVLNGLLAAEAPPASLKLGILHAGTGGDFRRLLHGGGELDTYLAGLPAEAVPIDVIKVDFLTDAGEPASRYCLNMATAGLSGAVVRRVNKMSKRLGGTATFFVATIRSVMRYRPARVRINLDDTELGESTIQNIIAANGRWAWGGMCLAPGARLTDGLLEVVVLQDAPLHRTLSLTNKIYAGTHVHHRYCRRASRQSPESRVSQSGTGFTRHRWRVSWWVAGHILDRRRRYQADRGPASVPVITFRSKGPPHRPPARPFEWRQSDRLPPAEIR